MSHWWHEAAKVTAKVEGSIMSNQGKVYKTATKALREFFPDAGAKELIGFKKECSDEEWREFGEDAAELMGGELS